MAELKLHRLFGDGMVLQRDKPLRVWGWASPGDTVRLSLADRSAEARVAADGRWELVLDPLPAGGPHVLQVRASSGGSVRCADVLFGDVWLCSGQSNFVLPINRVRDRYAAELSTAENTLVRRFLVPDRYDFNNPLPDLDGGAWEAATPETLGQFSALAWFFADELQRCLGVPIGVICASVGGAPISAFLGEGDLAAWPRQLEALEQCRDREAIRRIQAADEARLAAWHADLWQRDAGNGSGEPAWSAPELATDDWQEAKLPAWLDETPIGAMHGSVWFRTEIELSPDQASLAARFDLGTLVDEDQAWINGVAIGSTGYQYPPRRYPVPSGLLRAGRNSIVIRLVSNQGRGGFIQDKPCCLRLGDGMVDLRGSWRCRIGARAEPLAAQTFFQYRPAGLFNGMIHPLFGFGIKGFAWYQGESNTETLHEAPPYHEFLEALIQAWRQGFGEPDLPFLVVQLANFGAVPSEPGESSWAALRDEQSRALSLEATALVTAIDLGEANDLHPENKKELGIRLALAARRLAGGAEDLVASGPIVRSIEVLDHRVEIAFDSVGGGLVAQGGSGLRHFALAAADGHFLWAQARIEGERVVVWHEGIPGPRMVRYAWADNPAGANLYNREGLPAFPFCRKW